MSSGIDSSVAAIVLKEKGFGVIRVTFNNLGCNGSEIINQTKSIAEKLGIAHYVYDLTEEFKQTVIRYFVNEYKTGRTPNPCVYCNKKFKWHYLLLIADRLKCNLVATGHYAGIRKENGRFILTAGKDKDKDQSYFLWMLEQNDLKRTLFPLADLTKQEVRDIALKNNFADLAAKRESYSICFIRDNNYTDFLMNTFKDQNIRIKSGDIYTKSGKKIGRHKGIPFYTVGQKIMVNDKELYIHKIDQNSNSIIAGSKEYLYGNKLLLSDVNLIKYESLMGEFKGKVKIRGKESAKKAVIIEQNKKLNVKFEKNVFGIAPGQSAVIYEGNDVVAGGIIK